MSHSLILIRHGETEWNVEGRYQGQSDPPLNRRGREQALGLSEKLLAAGLDLLYSSPLERARQTGQILADRLSIPLHIDARLQEIHLGKWEGLLHDEIYRVYPKTFRQWEEDPWSVTPPGGESIYGVRSRIMEATEEILSRHRGQTIGLVSHLLPLVLLKINFDGIHPSRIWDVSLPNAHWEKITLRGR